MNNWGGGGPGMGPRGWGATPGPYGYPMGGPGWGGPALRGPFSPGARMGAPPGMGGYGGWGVPMGYPPSWNSEGGPPGPPKQPPLPGVPGEDPVPPGEEPAPPPPPGPPPPTAPKAEGTDETKGTGGEGEAGGGEEGGDKKNAPVTDTTPASVVNGVAFNIAGQRIPGFNPYPTPMMMRPPMGMPYGYGPMGGMVGPMPGKKKKKQMQQQQMMMGMPPLPGGFRPMAPGVAASGAPLRGPFSPKPGPKADSVANSPQANEWPDSLKKYVSRCFSKCVTDVDKDQVEIILKGKITKAAADKSLWNKDWDNEPLPGTLSTDMSTRVMNPTAFGTLRGRGRGGGIGFGRGGFAGGRNRFGRAGGDSPPRRRRRSNSSSSEEGGGRNSKSSMGKGKKSKKSKPDYGDNPNMVPLGESKVKAKGKDKGKGNKMMSRLGLKGNKNLQKLQQMQQDGATAFTPYFYTDGKMTLEGDLATSQMKQKRAARFAGGSSSKGPKKRVDLASLNSNLLRDDSNGSGGGFEENALAWESMHIVGTCTDLEKPFLRLTAAPEPHMVRPVEVLKKSLKHAVEDWKKKQDYHFACDQMKSIRQDLTVQGVRDKFTVKVYETHARIALEKGDYTEFNQCQSQLKMLYHDIGGDNRLEFTSYRLLYYMYTKETMDITSALAELTPEEKEDECVSYSMKLRDAWSLQNYRRFFRLYHSAPKMSGYLIDWFINRERKAALRIIVKAYRVSIPVDFVKSQLAFGNDEDWQKFIEPLALTFADPGEKTKLDCKASMAALPNLQ